MTAYPRPAEREQIVVPLHSAVKKTASSRPAPAPVPAGIPEVDHDACVEFAESRRTGNIEITVRSSAARQRAENSPGASSPVLNAVPSTLGSRPRPHAGMPAATGDFREDLRTLRDEAPSGLPDGMIEDLMAQGTAEPATGSARRGSGTPALHGGMDVRLARIIDAWPRLSAKTRAAMTATLDDVGLVQGPGIATSQVAHPPLAVRTERRGEAQAKSTGAAGRRRKGRE